MRLGGDGEPNSAPECPVRTNPFPMGSLFWAVYRVSDYVDAGTSNRAHERLRRLGQDPGRVVGDLLGYRLGDAHGADRQLRQAAQRADAPGEVIESGAHAKLGEHSEIFLGLPAPGIADNSADRGYRRPGLQ